MRDAVNSKQEELNPILLSQGMDEFYLKKGLEFVSYTNLQTAKEQLERAQEQKGEAEEVLPEL